MIDRLWNPFVAAWFEGKDDPKLQLLRFDPADIRYVLISHGHLDHAGGAKLLQERYGARVLMACARPQ